MGKVTLLTHLKTALSRSAALVSDVADALEEEANARESADAAMQTKLNGIAAGAEVNQNAFSNVAVGDTTIAADSKTDTLTLVAGSNVTLTADAANDKVTIAAKDTIYTAGTGLALSGTQFKHSNAITAGTAQGDADKTLTYGGTFAIPTVTYDAQGHITGKGTTTMTMPAAPSSVATASKLGSATVGSGTRPIYLNAGTATASSGTVGTASKPVYLNAGTLTACTYGISVVTSLPASPDANTIYLIKEG